MKLPLQEERTHPLPLTSFVMIFVTAFLVKGLNLLSIVKSQRLTGRKSKIEGVSNIGHPAKKQSIEEINALIKKLQPNEGQISDGYHTFDELYDFRREYNAALVNTHVYPCHKSLRHSDGELCFGGGWFIVMINLPTGQISNHYEVKYWNEFNCEERECAEPWDGHTEKDVLARLSDLNLNNSVKNHTITDSRKDIELEEEE